MENNTLDIFGRVEIISLLDKRINDLKQGYRQNIALIGAKLVGKTSIIKSFITGEKNLGINYIFIESDTYDFKVFVNKFVGSLLNSIAVTDNLPTSNSIEFLLHSLQNKSPLTCEHIKKVIAGLDKEKNVNIFNALIDTVDIYSKESNKACLVILDEFQDIIETLNIESAYEDLSKKITVQRNCMYILISSAQGRAKKILSENLSLLFGNFETIEVKPFNIQATREFINHCLHEVKLAASLQNFLFDLTSGQPFYLDIICRELLKLTRSLNDQVVTLSMFSRCLSHLLCCEWGLLNQRFQNYVDRVNQGKSGYLLLSALLAVAMGKRRINDLTAYLHKQKSVINMRINRLVELDILSKNGNFYYVTDKVFAFWLNFVYMRKMNNLTNAGITDDDANFPQEIENIIGNFIKASQKSIQERITDLFNLFENESVQMNGYKYRLFRFKEIDSLEFSELDNSPGLIAHSKNILWLILVLERKLMEEDVRKFIAQCNQYKTKPQRRIIVSIEDTDHNAKLKALQEKVWVWNLADVNLFLSLHGKNFIVK